MADDNDNPPVSTQEQELDSLDFDQLLGAPMAAAVNAEAQSAWVTLNYIQQVAFGGSGGSGGSGSGTSGTLQTASFSYTKAGVDQTITVPLLAMVPIPYLRVSQLTVDLNVKLTSTTQSTSETDWSRTIDSGSSGGFLSFLSPVKFTCTVTDRSTTTNTASTDEEYNLAVRLTAVQDAQPPGGLAKILDIFQDAIEPQSAAKQS